jgi:hypothetical protein
MTAIDPKVVDLESLPWLPLTERSSFPQHPAIYIAIDGLGKVQYVGISKDPRQRWAQHSQYQQLQSMGRVKIAYLFVDNVESLRPIEIGLINRFRPPLNTMGVPRTKAREIKSTLTFRQSTKLPETAGKYPTVRVYFTEKGLKERFNTACFYRGRKMSDVIQELINCWTEEQEALIEEERKARMPITGWLGVNLANLVGAYLLLRYRGTETEHIEQMAQDCQIAAEEINAALDGKPVGAATASKLANILKMSLSEFQTIAPKNS